MINPNPNIDFNLCYSLQPQKNNKSLPAKRITKVQKIVHPFNHDSENKHPKKNIENNIKRANENKTVTDPKKSVKKKQQIILRNTNTPDPYNERRIKTQGPSTEQIASTQKKQPKKVHHKSTYPTLGKNTISTKKDKSAKSAKIPKEKHIKSCQIYGAWRRVPGDILQHTISQSINGIPKKKRANSAILCNDKVVTKLLNVSMMASELGGTRPITSDRNSSKSNFSKTFKEYMNSTDLRIIRNIQDDAPIFLKKQSSFQDTVRSLMQLHQISLEELTRKVVIIQKCWRKRQKRSIIGIYKRIFQKATDLFQRDKIDEVSNIPNEEDKSFSNGSIQIFNNQNLASLKKSHQSSGKVILDDDQDRMSLDDNDSDPDEEILNFQKYKQLVKEEIDSKTKRPPGMLTKGSLDSRFMLDELMRQNINRREQEQLDLTNLRQLEMPIERPFQLPNSLQSQDQDSELNHNTLETFPRISKNDDDDSFDDSQVYPNNKYALIPGREAPRSVQQNTEQLNKKIINLRQMEIQIAKHSKNLNEKDQISEKIEKKINENYLDCDFAIHKVQQISQMAEEHEENQQLQNSFDEAIGMRFQRANLNILRKHRLPDSQVEPKAIEKIERFTELQAQQLITELVQFLIAQFASDISVILKKCTYPPPERPRNPPAPRPPGIQTNFNSILTYVAKFIQFINEKQEILDKITDNINKDIGPSSLEILTYLRPELEDGQMMPQVENQCSDYQEEEGLFVVPADLFDDFETHLAKQESKEVGPRVKAYLSFWHRCIFESYNECLDYERPYGIEGKPYQWVTEAKIMRRIQRQKISGHMHNAENRLLELTTVVGGIIFEKMDSPFFDRDLSEQQMQMMNEERLSRILATELLESERSWINYNDELAQLLVELSRMVEERLFMEYGAEVRKLQRRRRMIAQESSCQDTIMFSIGQLI